MRLGKRNWVRLAMMLLGISLGAMSACTAVNGPPAGNDSPGSTMDDSSPTDDASDDGADGSMDDDATDGDVSDDDMSGDDADPPSDDDPLTDDDTTDNGDTSDDGTDEPLPLGKTYAVVDTGQSACYGDTASISCPAAGATYFGQDAQYDGHQPSYTTSADGLTVYDDNTGLTWQKGYADEKLTYGEALDYVDTMNAQALAGKSDWRLPTIKQLYSLIDFRGTDPPPESTSEAGLTPFIDDSVFDFAYGDTSAGERIIDSQWATSTLYVADNNMLFGVNFADGRIKGYERISPDPMRDEKTFMVRLCRGNADYGANEFTDNGDGTVTDAATDLMWTQADSGAGLTWSEALAWLEARNAEDHLGYNDWRLPNAKELQSILDYTRSPDTTASAAIDPVFEATSITNLVGEADYPFYWSSTTHLRGDGSAYNAVYLSFGRGLGSYDGTTIVDVHGAGCQRSDPKDGSAADYPQYGHGPQGDVQRVFNFVRMVRDVD